MDYIFMKCPLCFWINMVRPDEKSHKCPGHAINGKQGNLGTYRTHFEESWRGVQVNRSKTCNFELFHPDGRPVMPLPLCEYIKFTKPETFSVRDLEKLIIEKSLLYYSTIDTSR